MWGLPCPLHYCNGGALLPHLFTLTPAFSSILDGTGEDARAYKDSQERRGGMFSVALAVECVPTFDKSGQKWATLSRTLSGTLLCGVRTFLPAHSRESFYRFCALPRMDGATVRPSCQQPIIAECAIAGPPDR